MSRYFATFIGLSFLSVAFASLGWGLAFRLAPEGRQRPHVQWLVGWTIKGLIVPGFLWALMNIGLSWNIEPLLPEVQQAKNSGQPWFAVFLSVAAAGWFVVSSYWAALTLGLATLRVTRGLKGEPRSDFRALCLTAGIGMSIPAAAVLLLGGWPTLGMAVCAILVPIAGYAPSVLNVQKTPPMYARAIARIKFGKYSEAESVIIEELEKCEDDFEGWMMLAELYATKFNDIGEAEQTVLEICDHPKTTPSQLSIALHRLAGWHLNQGNNPDAARRALQMICTRLPGTHLAYMAQMRLNQLPETPEELREQRVAKPIPLPQHEDRRSQEPPLPPPLPRTTPIKLVEDITPVPAPPKPDPSPGTGREKPPVIRLVLPRPGSPMPVPQSQDQTPAATDVKDANRCVETLKREPNDVAAREELAHLFVERLNQPERGLEQILMLANQPDQPEAKRAEWLGLAADWHLHALHDTEASLKILHRLMSQFPTSPQAAVARARLGIAD